jgi:sterol 14-demethylase
MAAVMNGTLPLPDAFSSYLAEAQAKITELNTRTLLLLLVNVPVLAIVLNVVRQLVSAKAHRTREFRDS